MRFIVYAVALTAGLALVSCQTTPPKVLTQAPSDEQLQQLEAIPATLADRTLASLGFQRLSEADLTARMADNTLRTASAAGYYGSDGKILLKVAALGGRLRSSGTWTIENANLCHSVSDGHQFCTALFFRGDELICWPGADDPSTETGYLRPCEIIEGNRAS